MRLSAGLALLLLLAQPGRADIAVASPSDLPRYHRARRLQTVPYQLFSRALTPLFQSSGAVGPLIRRTLFAPLSQAPGLAGIAAHLLTGTFRLGRTRPELRP